MKTQENVECLPIWLTSKSKLTYDAADTLKWKHGVFVPRGIEAEETWRRNRWREYGALEWRRKWRLSRTNSWREDTATAHGQDAAIGAAPGCGDCRYTECGDWPMARKWRLPTNAG